VCLGQFGGRFQLKGPVWFPARACLGGLACRPLSLYTQGYYGNKFVQRKSLELVRAEAVRFDDGRNNWNTINDVRNDNTFKRCRSDRLMLFASVKRSKWWCIVLVVNL
jgi:hypothetical protein